MIMLMGVHHKQRQSSRPMFGKQLQNRIGEGHLTRATESPGVDQKGPVSTDEQIEEIGFKVGTRVLANDKRVRIVGMHLERGLGGGLAVLRPLICQRR
jgi:hypothetical protein